MARNDFTVWEEPDTLGYFMGDVPLPWPDPASMKVCNEIMAATEDADDHKEVTIP